MDTTALQSSHVIVAAGSSPPERVAPPFKTLQGRAGVYWLVAFLALVPAAVKLLCYPHYIGSDDAYIHLRVAINFVGGLGWGINPHQPVNLSTSPAFTWLLAAAERITDHPVGLMQILSACSVAVGLVLIFLAAFSETGSVNAALFAEIAAAFSVNLWRWSGSLMEATFGFAVIALVVYLFRTDAPNAPGRLFISGVVLGVGVLLRPEIVLVVVLALFVQFMRSERASRLKDAALVILGLALVVTPWCIFALRHFGSVTPTTFAAKATEHFRLFNGVILAEFMESVVESLLFPTLLILYLVLAVRRKDVASKKRKDALSFVIPVGWIVGLIGFYYLKTPYLQSPGRYLLPLLPCEVMLLALLWSEMEGELTLSQRRIAAAVIALHVVCSITLNYKVVAPVLRRFEGGYAATMRAAAEELAKQTEASGNRRVLVKPDIGVLSCAANGRFEIYDGGALATPSLRGLALREQVMQVRPAYVIESFAETPDGLGSKYPDLLAKVWERRFRQQSVRKSIPYYYTIIFRSREPVMSASK